MAGLDLASKLRRGLGSGSVVAAAELTSRIAEFDADGDGLVTQAELSSFLRKHRVGGPWFCDVVAKTLWGYVERWFSQKFPSIQAEVLGRLINQTMKQPPAAARRYELNPEAMSGYEPRKNAKSGSPSPTQESSGDALGARPRASDPGPRAAPSGASALSRGQPSLAARAPKRPGPRRPGPRR